MSKCNVLTDKGKGVMMLLRACREELDNSTQRGTALYQAVVALHRAVDLLVSIDGPCWELEDQ
jgi:hypothetical protein